MRSLLLVAPFALVAGPVLAAGFDLPPRAAGQWEMNIQSDVPNAPAQTIRMCLDAESDKLLNERFGGMASAMCSRQDQKKEGDAIVLESDCRVGDMTTTSRTVVTGDFNSAYTMKTETQMSGSNAPRSVQAGIPQGKMSQTTTIEAKRSGDCAAGMKPGDIEFGEGRRMNVRDMPAPQPIQ